MLKGGDTAVETIGLRLISLECAGALSSATSKSFLPSDLSSGVMGNS